MKGLIGRFRALLILGSVAFILAGCGKENLTTLIPKGHGAKVSLNLIILTTVVMSLVFIVVMIIYVIVLVRFRKRKGDKVVNPEQVEGNRTLETVWTIIPIILVVIMAVPTVFATFLLADDSDAHENINVDVTGKQFWWHFDYVNEEVSTSQDLYIPVNKKVYVNLLSDDVTHSFWVPSLEGKLDVNPENVNTMFLEAEEEGVYWGKCAEFCGLSHALMDFKVVVVSEAEYDQWISDMKAFDSSKLALDPIAQEGEEIFSESCIGCHATDLQNYSAGNVPVGPDLTNMGDRSRVAGIKELNEDEIFNWIKDPESVKPGNLMTGKYTMPEDEDIEKIVQYLLQLQPSEVTAESKEK